MYLYAKLGIIFEIDNYFYSFFQYLFQTECKISTFICIKQEFLQIILQLLLLLLQPRRVTPSLVGFLQSQRPFLQRT